MPAILGPTNPVPGQEPQPVRITTPQSGDTSIRNIVNPQQVTRPDNRAERQDNGEPTQSFVARYDSNFMTFLQRLRGSPDMAATFFQLVQGQGLQVSSGIQAGFAEEIAQFMEFLQLDEGQMVAFLQNQVESGSRFSGALFQSLLTAFAGTTSEGLKSDILQTLRRFNDYTSTDRLEAKMLRTLNDMGQAVPSRWANQLFDLVDTLERGMPGAARQQSAMPWQENARGQENVPDGAQQSRTLPDGTRQGQTLPDGTRQSAAYPNPGAARQSAAYPNAARQSTAYPDGTRQSTAYPSAARQGQTPPGGSYNSNVTRQSVLTGDPRLANARQQIQPSAPDGTTSDGARQNNLKILREQVFPLISQYVTLSHNHGKARALLSTLTLDMARYENGSEDALLQSVRRLALEGALPRQLEKLSDADLLRLLRTTEFSRASQSNAFADRLAELADRGLQGEGGGKVQEAFRNILSAVLVNESVYMPLMHVMLPVQWEDRLMYSEMWVDPDADGDPRNPAPPGEGTLRLLLKMDIQGVGAFDLLLNVRGEDVELQAACPPEVAALSGTVSQALDTILTRNGFRPQVSVGEMRRPVAISEAFPRIFEKASGVNVTV